MLRHVPSLDTVPSHCTFVISAFDSAFVSVSMGVCLGGFRFSQSVQQALPYCSVCLYNTPTHKSLHARSRSSRSSHSGVIASAVSLSLVLHAHPPSGRSRFPFDTGEGRSAVRAWSAQSASFRRALLPARFSLGLKDQRADPSDGLGCMAHRVDDARDFASRRFTALATFTLSTLDALGGCYYIRAVQFATLRWSCWAGPLCCPTGHLRCLRALGATGLVTGSVRSARCW